MKTTLKTTHIKVKLADIESNPYRDLKRLELNPEKVRILSESIKNTGFWENILIRRDPDKADKFQAGYGHHRIQSAKDCGIDEAVFIVADIPDEQMVQIMANENMQEWSSNLKVILETIIQVRNYLNDCLVNKKIPNVTRLYPDVNTLKRAEKAGVVGIDGVHRFLGDGWSRPSVGRAMFIITAVENKEVSMSNVLKFNSLSLAENFVRKVKADELKANEQKKLVQEISRNTSSTSLSDLLKPRVDVNKKKTDDKDITPSTPSVSSITSDLNNTITHLLNVNNKMKGIASGWKGHDTDKKQQFETIAKKFISYCEEIGFVKIEKVLLRKKVSDDQIVKDLEKSLNSGNDKAKHGKTA